ncbi:YciI family protein [Pendulispora rubella]|uniref:YciI family protein n=1 Tax=Pendulispora rubella TaxID=2741070 RepID=A0ABZ2KQG5_9BACT
MKRDNRDNRVAPDPKLMLEVGKFSQEMIRAGVVVATGGIASKGTIIKAMNGDLSTTDGPYAEAKEVIAGWVVLEVKSRAEAVAIAARFMKIHQDVLGAGWEGEAEILQVFGPEDFGPSLN